MSDSPYSHRRTIVVPAKPQPEQDPPPVKPVPVEIPTSDLDVAKLLNNSLTALHRDLWYITARGEKEKLCPTDARDLVNYVKLLKELEESERGKLEDLTKEQLLEVIEEAKGLIKSKDDSTP